MTPLNLAGVDDQRVGRVVRALRRRRGWRQVDLARKAGLSQAVISRLELGSASRLTVASLRRIAASLGAEIVLNVRWRGAEVDRLLDEGHASLVAAVIALLTQAGWEVHPEVSFSIFGERGSMDIVGWHAPSRTLLIVEVKTELVSVEETVRKLDAKVRLAPKVVLERFGWRPAFRSHLLVLPSTTTQRRLVVRHAGVFDVALPLRTQEMRTWLRVPEGAVGGLLFMPLTTGGRVMRDAVSRKRIRARHAELAERAADGPSGLAG